MLFDVYGPNALYQWMGLALVLVALIALNEFARRTKFGGCFMFFGVCGAMTIYCIAVGIGAASGAEWAPRIPQYCFCGLFCADAAPGQYSAVFAETAIYIC